VGAYTGDFRTSSGRQHFRPLRYWENERFEWSPGPESSIITQVVHAPAPLSPPKRAPRRGAGRPKAQIIRPPTPEEDPEKDIDKNVNLYAIIKEWGTDREVNRREFQVLVLL